MVSRDAIRGQLVRHCRLRNLGIAERQRDQEAGKQNPILHMQHAPQPGLGGDAVAAPVTAEERRLFVGRHDGRHCGIESGWQHR